jgi:3-dehydroquinate synthetase
MLPMCSAEVRERLLPVLRSLGLPTEIPGELEDMLESVSHDKKCTGSDVAVVWVETPGSFEIRKMPLSDWKEQIRAALCG